MHKEELNRARAICAAWHAGDIDPTPDNQMLYANALELVRQENQRIAKGRPAGPGPFTFADDAKWIKYA